MEGGTVDSPDAALNKNFDLDPEKATTDKCTLHDAPDVEGKIVNQ